MYKFKLYFNSFFCVQYFAMGFPNKTDHFVVTWFTHHSVSFIVRNLKFTRNLKFATSKTLVNFMKKVMLCLKIGIFQFKKP